MFLSGCGTAFVAGREFPAGAGAQWVERACGMFADFTAQGGTTRRLLFCAFHAYVIGTDRNSQMVRHRAMRMGISFRPIKRDAVGSAAGTASKANLTHRCLAKDDNKRFSCDGF